MYYLCQLPYPRPRPFCKYDLPDRAKASVMVGVFRYGGGSSLHFACPQEEDDGTETALDPLSLLGTSSKVAPGQQATLSVSRAGNSRVSVLIGRSESRLAPCLSPGVVTTLYNYTKHMLFQMSASLALYPMLLPFCRVAKARRPR